MEISIVDKSVKFLDGVDTFSIPVEAIENRLNKGEDSEALSIDTANGVCKVTRFESSMYIPETVFSYSYLYGSRKCYTDEQVKVNNERCLVDIFNSCFTTVKMQRIISTLAGYGGILVNNFLSNGTEMCYATKEELCNEYSTFVEKDLLSTMVNTLLNLRVNDVNNKMCLFVDESICYYISKEGKLTKSNASIITSSDISEIFKGKDIIDIIGTIVPTELCDYIDNEKFRRGVYKLILSILCIVGDPKSKLCTFEMFDTVFREAINLTTAINVYKMQDPDSNNIPITVADCMDSQVLLKMIYNMNKDAYSNNESTNRVLEVTEENVDDYISRFTNSQKVNMVRQFMSRN